jgi:hypothetical protein
MNVARKKSITMVKDWTVSVASRIASCCRGAMKG